MQLPKMAKATQLFHQPEVVDLQTEIKTKLAEKQLKNRVKPGQRIAVTAGSRGIANIPVILKTIIDELRALGTEPFIVPAMGSHGGATREASSPRI